MSRRRGFTLIEMIVAIGVFAIVLSLVTAISLRFETSNRRLAEAMADLRTAERFMLDLKRDLAAAPDAAVEPSRVRLGGTVYEFLAEEGSVTRTGPEPPREYRYAFESVAFESEGALLRVDVELRKQDPESPVRPRWRTIARRP
jgi:prepilin-type N-terminal cleavage/methylation domain-containing protein